MSFGSLVPASLVATGAAMIALAGGGLASVDRNLAAEAADRQPIGLEVVEPGHDCPRAVRL